MSDMDGNPHAAQATSRLRNGTHTEVARAAVEATLALAYEQRTANLLALAAMSIAAGHPISKQIAEDMDARLGLRKGGTK